MDVHEFLSYCIRFYQVQNDEKRISELSEIFELDLNRKIAELSMGNRKKVSIVQSMLHSPKLLILDEPTTGPVSYTHLRAHETRHDLVCRLLLEKKKKQ